MQIRTYTELCQVGDYTERYEYLRLGGGVGRETFGFDRWLNQAFYRSGEWKRMRSHCIARDLGLDMAFYGYEIRGDIYVHHMNPLTKEQIVEGDSAVLDPEFLVCVSHNTHNAIHYGDAQLLPQPLVERRPGDTTLW